MHTCSAAVLVGLAVTPIAAQTVQATLLAVSPTVAALTGLQDAELLGRSRWVELIHPDDRDRFVAVCRALGDGQSTQVEHRLRTAQGVYRWIRTFLVASAGEDGTQLIGGVSVEAAPTAD